MNVDEIRARALSSQRLELAPLRVEDAAEMAAILDDIHLHTFIGGQPATPDELRRRYERQVVGHSPDGSQIWLNWIVRRRDNGQAVGTVQATITEQDGRPAAEIAWVIATSQQGRGYARESAQTMADWLREQQIEPVIALIHPEHEASMAVARAAGLAPTDVIVDGEVRWQAG